MKLKVAATLVRPFPDRIKIVQVSNNYFIFSKFFFIIKHVIRSVKHHTKSAGVGVDSKHMALVDLGQRVCLKRNRKNIYKYFFQIVLICILRFCIFQYETHDGRRLYFVRKFDEPRWKKLRSKSLFYIVICIQKNMV